MRNFVQEGRRLTITAAAVISAGQVVTQEGLIGVAQDNATTGQSVVIALDGVFTVTKPSASIITQGRHVYWNSGSGMETLATTTRTYAGVAAATALTGTSIDVLFGYAPRQAFTA